MDDFTIRQKGNPFSDPAPLIVSFSISNPKVFLLDGSPLLCPHDAGIPLLHY